ncbi:hypothetical protein [Novosphingobium sp. 9]|uniref:hypothetical protein n=1 Tax=Novosphingobium sp. 9 TaxID=2025349 RepID=UPI0021B51ED3|nr:hypothetical protein [Novosphingobium sp. 9]
MKTREAVRLKVHVPVAPETLAAMLAGDAEAAERDAVLAAMFAIVRADNPLGHFDLYSGVVELSPGWESFRPGASATPTLGISGETALSPTVALVIHAACTLSDPALDHAVAQIMAAHPWEMPVIEIAPVRLVVR